MINNQACVESRIESGLENSYRNCLSICYYFFHIIKLFQVWIKYLLKSLINTIKRVYGYEIRSVSNSVCPQHELSSSKINKIKSRIIFRAGLPFYFFNKKNGKKKLARIQFNHQTHSLYYKTKVRRYF